MYLDVCTDHNVVSRAAFGHSPDRAAGETSQIVSLSN